MNTLIVRALHRKRSMVTGAQVAAARRRPTTDSGRGFEPPADDGHGAQLRAAHLFQLKTACFAPVEKHVDRCSGRACALPAVDELGVRLRAALCISPVIKAWTVAPDQLDDDGRTQLDAAKLVGPARQVASAPGHRRDDRALLHPWYPRASATAG